MGEGESDSEDGRRACKRGGRVMILGNGGSDCKEGWEFQENRVRGTLAAGIWLRDGEQRVGSGCGHSRLALLSHWEHSNSAWPGPGNKRGASSMAQTARHQSRRQQNQQNAPHRGIIAGSRKDWFDHPAPSRYDPLRLRNQFRQESADSLVVRSTFQPCAGAGRCGLVASSLSRDSHPSPAFTRSKSANGVHDYAELSDGRRRSDFDCLSQWHKGGH